MTLTDLREHVELRLATPGGTIARITGENHAGEKGAVIRDVNPIALAFVRASHVPTCDCSYCTL